MRKTLFTIVMILLTLVSFAKDNYNVIRNPLPTSHGFKKLIKLKEISSVQDLPGDDIPGFAIIIAATADASGNFYLFDHKYSAIIKLDKNLKFVKSFGRKGEGPGEFKSSLHPSAVGLSVGLDGFFYYSSVMGKRIMKFTLDGKYLDTFKVQHFKPFKAAVDEKGRIFLTSTRDQFVLEVYGKQMKPIKKLLPNSIRSTFLFSAPPDCVLYRLRVPDSYVIMTHFLTNGDLLVANSQDLSLMILDKSSGEIKKQFYAWDDYILAELPLRMKAMQDKVKRTGATCGYTRGISRLFVDSCDNIFLVFNDSMRNMFIYHYSLEGELKQVYRVDTSKNQNLMFFHSENGRFYATTRGGIHIFSR